MIYTLISKLSKYPHALILYKIYKQSENIAHQAMNNSMVIVN